MTTLREIAERVGVSISTVSRVINQDDSRRISDETKQKIWKVAKEMDYRSSRRAKSYRSGAKRGREHVSKLPVIGCIVALQDNKYNHPYFSPIIQGMEAKLLESGLTLSFLHTQAELKNEVLFNTLLDTRGLSGLICIEGLTSSLYKRLKERVPVIVGIDVNDSEIPIISYDRMSAAHTAVKHLIELGHQDIGFIGGTGLSGKLDREKRFAGYRRALEEYQLPYQEQWTINSHWDADKSYEQMKALLMAAERPTAMFCASDMMAIAAMRAVTEAGLSIPRDISFIGIDDIEFSKYTTPPLSTIHIPKYEMGYAAAKTLLDSLEDPYPFAFRMQLPFKLITRSSVTRVEAMSVGQI